MTPDNSLATTEQYIEMERRDEDQILNELQGNILKEMFYETRDKKTVVSWIGIKEIARTYGGIDVNLVEKTDLGEHWFVVVKATDKKNSYSMLGASTQAKMMDVYDSNEKGVKLDTTHKESDPFVLQKAFSKAQRNAIRALIPETYFAQMIDTWRKTGKQPAKPIPQVTVKKEPPKKVESTAEVKEENPPAFVNAADLPKLPDDFHTSEQAGFIVDYIVENYGQQLDTVRAMVWREIQQNPVTVTDVEAAKEVQQQFEERSKPPESSLYDALKESDLDPQKITITDDGTEVKPVKFLGDLWGGYNDLLRKRGYSWVRDDKNSRWEKQP